MTNYEKLVEALRILQDKNSLSYYKRKVCKDAADAIEALNRLVDLNTERCEGLRKQLREAQEQYDKHLNELEQQLSKRGEWKVDMSHFSPHIVCSVCGVEIPCVAGWCMDAHMNYCPNCGAKMEPPKEDA